MKIIVETSVISSMSKVWKSYTSPENIIKWNAASDDWHTVKSVVDLRVGGLFSSRMEAKDGSFGFDFEGMYTNIIENSLIEYSFGGRSAKVEFSETPSGINVKVTFDSEDSHSIDQQRDGWQAILNNFKRHTECS